MYELLILLGSQTPAGLDDLERAVVREYASLTPPQAVQTNRTSDHLTISVRDFRFYVDVSCDPHVLEESREIAAMFAGNRSDKNEIAQARCRYELSSDDDPDLARFNDLIFICQAAEATGKVFLFDPQAGTFY